MKDKWIKFGCILTGYNYEAVKQCSLATEKAVKKYTSALLLVSLVWGFVGFFFANTYLKSNLIISLCSAAAMIFIVIQIERQIILTIGKNKWTTRFRAAIGFAIAVLGSLIIDQMLFSGDIELKKREDNRDNYMKSLDTLIINMNNDIAVKEDKLNTLYAMYDDEPQVKGLQQGTYYYTIDSSTGKPVLKGKDITTTVIENPVLIRIGAIKTDIDDLNKKVREYEKTRINVPPAETFDNNEWVEDTLKRNHTTYKFAKPFLHELTIIRKVLTSNVEALVVWGLFFIVFGCIELFVLFIKYGEDVTDYEELIKYQRTVKIAQLKALGDKQNQI